MMKEIKNDVFKHQLITASGYHDKFSIDVINDTFLFHIMPGDFIVREGELPDYVFYLARGRTKLYVTSANGRISLIDFFDAPCFIGEIELLDEHHSPRAVQSIEACWCLALPVKHYRAALLNDAVFLRHVCLGLTKKNFRNIVSSTRNQSFPLINRLAAFILLTEHDGVYNEKHTQAAEYLGVTYRHLLYVFAQFSEEGLVRKQKTGFVLNNRKALVALAQEMEPGGVTVT